MSWKKTVCSDEVKAAVCAEKKRAFFERKGDRISQYKVGSLPIIDWVVTPKTLLIGLLTPFMTWKGGPTLYVWVNLPYNQEISNGQTSH